MKELFVKSKLLQRVAVNNTQTLGRTDELSNLTYDYKQVAVYFIGAGFLFAGIIVVKKLASGEDNASKLLIGYIVALITFLGIWSLI